jgi:hypothetical protein
MNTHKNLLSLMVISAALALSGCASSGKQAKEAAAAKPAISGNIPAGSPFSKLAIGMSRKQAHDLIGPPSDEFTYSTGKMWIPFYFGKDMVRLEDLYKGQGRITYTGAGVGGVNYRIDHIEYDPTEDGYSDKK